MHSQFRHRQPSSRRGTAAKHGTYKPKDRRPSVKGIAARHLFRPVTGHLHSPGRTVGTRFRDLYGPFTDLADARPPRAAIAKALCAGSSADGSASGREEVIQSRPEEATQLPPLARHRTLVSLIFQLGGLLASIAFLGGFEWHIKLPLPVRPGDRLHTEVKIQGKKPSSKPGRGYVTTFVHMRSCVDDRHQAPPVDLFP